ncbi:sulfide/dihydroorotate dehydrogenase-like FAD/NAD-binding protein [bacterium]|nr:MAG: sulfide/dihydroorotate dehydrogenase-like FAD/NAD-binding protein [bacterium]
MFKILEKEKLGPQIYSLVIEAKLIAKRAQAGQFVIARIMDKGERIPLTIADFNRQTGAIAIVFQEAGKSTQLLAALKKSDFILDLLGPQGNPTEIENYGNVVVVGGGIGVAAIYPIIRALKEKSNHVTAILGYRSVDYVFWEEKIKNYSDRLLVVTNDGSYARQGLVTDILKELIQHKERIDRVIAVGPTVMMKAVTEVTAGLNIKTIVSLNSLMVCGMGMCGACRVSVAGQMKFTCMDGPDFDGHMVDFKELSNRLNTYKGEESNG